MRPIPVAFHIGPLEIHTYGLGLAVTFWFAYRYFERRLGARGYPTHWMLSLFLWVVLTAVVGARALHVLANLSYYRSDPAEVFAIWHGGLSSWGGLLFAVPAGVIVTRRRCPELRMGDALDIVAPVLAAAWAVGRLLGPQLMVAGGGHPTHQWFGMYYAGQAGKRLPVPIFQAVEDATIFCVLLVVERHLRRSARDTPHDDTTARPKDPGTDGVAGAVARTTPPAGAVVGTAMVLWGIERVVDERLWLAYPGHVGDVLVEAAGVALAAGGVVVLVRFRRRWVRWLAPGGAALGEHPDSGAGGDLGADPPGEPAPESVPASGGGPG